MVVRRTPGPHSTAMHHRAPVITSSEAHLGLPILGNGSLPLKPNRQVRLVWGERARQWQRKDRSSIDSNQWLSSCQSQHHKLHLHSNAPAAARKCPNASDVSCVERSLVCRCQQLAAADLLLDRLHGGAGGGGGLSASSRSSGRRLPQLLQLGLQSFNMLRLLAAAQLRCLKLLLQVASLSGEAAATLKLSHLQAWQAKGK